MIRTPKRLQGQSPAHVRSRRQERETAKRIGGQTTRGSGSGYEQGDVRLCGFLRVECKTTQHASFSVTEALIDKLEASCVGTNEIPVMQIELRLGARKVVVMPDWALDWIAAKLAERSP